MINPEDFGFGDGKEPYCLPDGSDAELKIIEVERRVKTHTDGVTEILSFQVRFEIVGHDLSKEIGQYIEIPNKKLGNDKRYNRSLYNLQEFFAAFNIDPGPHDPVEEWPNKTGYVILSRSEDPQYGTQNRIRKYMSGR